MNASAPLPPTPSSADAATALDAAVQAQLSKFSMGLSPISLALAYSDWLMHLAVSPGRQLQLMQQWVNAASLDPAAKSTALEADARFADLAWQQWPFNQLHRSFKASEDWWRAATQVQGLSAHHRHVVSFFNRQALDAVSPSNGLLTNPQVLEKGLATFGQSWFKGAQQFWHDVLTQPTSRQAGAAHLNPLPYQVGKDVAVTPGKVVFRNHLIELIQYTPSTPTVWPEPLLIVPSNIMKFYILDLSPKNSMVRYLVGQGHTVFMISWRNPDASDRHLGMQDYLETGVMTAMGEVKALTQAPRIHALGYCLGGTFLAIVAAALGRCQAKSAVPKRRGRQSDQQHRRQDDVACWDSMPELASVTLLAAQTDFQEPGELGVFIDDDQLNTLRAAMARTGFMSGSQMAGSFQFLNARDLIWSRHIRRYLMGEDDVGNDMMSWNADVTRLPERMHNEYLSSLFLNNALAQGHYRLGGQGVALVDMAAPLLVVGTLRDHVSPWRSVFKIHLHTQNETTFILAAGGHNAGIVSEPGHPRRSYQIDHLPQGHGWVDPDEWLAHAPLVQGSWWPAMHDWLKARSGTPVPASPIDASRVVCDAPGQYIEVRYADD